MHYVFGMYGIKHHMDEVIKWLETRHFVMTGKDKDGKPYNNAVQGAIRPLMLFEYVFPEEHKDAVLNTLKADFQPYEQYGKAMKIAQATFRKALKCEKIPKFDKDKIFPMPPMHLNNVSIVPIGVRYDGEFTEKDGRTHEAL